MKPSSILRLSGVQDVGDKRSDKLHAGITGIVVSHKCFGIDDGDELIFLLTQQMLGPAGRILLEMKAELGAKSREVFQNAIDAIAKLIATEFQHSKVEVQLDVGQRPILVAKSGPQLG